MGVFIFLEDMTQTNLTSPFSLSKRASKQLAIFLIAAFAHSFSIAPAFAADISISYSSDVYVYGNERQVIKSPDSRLALNERLVAAATDNSNLPASVEKFKLLPASEKLQAGRIIKGKPLFFSNDPAPAGGKVVTMTAYNSEKGQTDDDPCTAAGGFNLCKHNKEDSVAANFLPLGSVIKAPELFGDREFVVRDRTHPKYGDRVDFWFKSRNDALQFGKRRAAIIVVSTPEKVRIATTR